MAKTRTEALSGAALEYATCKAMNYPVMVSNGRVFIEGGEPRSTPGFTRHWAEAGPLVELYNITLNGWRNKKEGTILVRAEIDANERTFCIGPDHLTAICRVVCLYVLGSVVDIPDSLLREAS